MGGPGLTPTAADVPKGGMIFVGPDGNEKPHAWFLSGTGPEAENFPDGNGHAGHCERTKYGIPGDLPNGYWVSLGDAKKFPGRKAEWHTSK